ncbi:MAG: hypothetical protein DWQ01_14050 [Planctomycetota bacterium]|nr:MAG: hypothetical protein DWQ01_14050 [Planctomycetota bacterium]
MGSLALVLTTGACFNSNQPSSGELNAKGKSVLRLEKVEWGRLVNVADVNGVLIEENVLIRQDLQPDGVSYDLETNSVTEEQTLVILHASTSPQFNILLDAAQAGLDDVVTKGPSNAPPFTQIARNAAVRLCFSEQVDPDTVSADTIRVVVGDPPSLQFSIRYIVQNDAKNSLGYIILDPTISARQSAQAGLPQNAVGFPASLDSIADNLMIRIPTEINTALGQPEVLRNLRRTRKITPSASDPLESDFGTIPVIVRSLRSGNESDPSQGFLPDEDRPDLITVKDVVVDSVDASSGTGKGSTRDITYHLDSTLCAGLEPKAGDVFEIADKVLTVTTVLSNANPAAYQVRATLVDEDEVGGISFDVGGGPFNGRMTTRYTPQDSDLQICYLEFLPEPTLVAGSPTELEVEPVSTTVTVRFDEPVDARSVRSMHSFVLTAYESTASQGDPRAYYQQFESESVGNYLDRLLGYDYNANNPGSSEYGGRVMFGEIEVGNGNRTFTLRPMAGFTDPDGSASGQYYAVALRDGPDGIQDLAGNPVNFVSMVPGTPGSSGAIDKLITHSGTTTRHKYFSLRGAGIDENGDGLPEYGGQFDVLPGQITGRPPTRFSVNADTSNQYVGSLPPVPSPGASAQVAPIEPLTPAGSVVMTTYRPHDMGFGYLDPQEYNLDVEGLSWTPLGGVVLDDNFNRFSVALSHADRMPDELRDIAGNPVFPFSGLRTDSEFDNNILGFPTHDELIVFDTLYSLRAVNLFQSESSGVTMLPWPTFTETYTYRDTAIPQTFTGTPAVGTVGSPPSTYTFSGFWGPEQVPSVGLPLCARFRCFPRGTFLGINTFQVTQMLPSSALPAFSVFSFGGQDAGDVWHQVIPDNPATGGTRPVGGFLNGQPTSAINNSFVYWAQLDFVVKVSRVYTHWFDMGTSLGPDDVIGVLLEPENAKQAEGTSVEVDFRGSVSVTNPNNPDQDPSPLTTTELPFDDYGDFVDIGVGSSVGTPSEWSSDPVDLESGTQPFQFFQVRISFLSNADQNVRAVMDGLGFAWKFPG